MKIRLKATVAALLATTIGVCSLLVGCGGAEKKYTLTINGRRDLLYTPMAASYKAGDEVTVKVKIKPFEGVKALLDGEALVKTKSTQNDCWTFSFEMPARNSTLDLSSFTGFEEPLLYGFHLTFGGIDNNEIEKLNKDFKSWVFFNEKTDALFTSTSAGHALSDIGYSSAFNEQHLSDERYNISMKPYNETFDSEIELNLKYIDYLTAVKVYEYDENHELIGSNAIAKDVNSYVASEQSEYVVIEEEYTVMKDGEHKGEKYYERTLINKTYYGEGKTLKYPRGDGLISPVYLLVFWIDPDMDEE